MQYLSCPLIPFLKCFNLCNCCILFWDLWSLFQVSFNILSVTFPHKEVCHSEFPRRKIVFILFFCNYLACILCSHFLFQLGLTSQTTLSVSYQQQKTNFSDLFTILILFKSNPALIPCYEGTTVLLCAQQIVMCQIVSVLKTEKNGGKRLTSAQSKKLLLHYTQSSTRSRQFSVFLFSFSLTLTHTLTTFYLLLP